MKSFQLFDNLRVKKTEHPGLCVCVCVQCVCVCEVCECVCVFVCV